MIKNFLNIFLLFLIFFLDKPIYSVDFSSKALEKYTSKISKKFSSTYCNSTKFGISTEGALKFAVGETNKEFLNNKLNKFIDNELLNKKILLNLENNCNIFDFPEDELENLTFK